MDNTKDTEIKVDEEQIQKDAERVAREKAIENVNKKMVIVDTEEMAEAEARKAADAYMTEDKTKSNIFRKFWKHTFLESYYREREVDRVREEILNSGNMYTGRVGDDKTAHNNTMQAVSERFISDYDGLVREGEKKEVLNDTDPKTVQAKNDIKNIITLYAQNNIQEEAFNEEKNRIFNRLNNKDTRDSLNSYADNLLEIAQNARIAIEHGAKMDEMDLDTNIILGKAKSSLKTEAHYNFVDKAVAWTKKSQIGRFFSPAFISTTIGLGYSLTVGLGTKVLRSKVAAYGTFGAAVAVSTALAGMNESQRLAAERAQHGLERAEGGIIGLDSERREEMEQFQYKMESSKNLTERLRASMFEKDKDGNDVPRDIKQADLDKIFASLAEIDARHSLNQQKSIDLISYTNIGAVEKESMELDILTARAKLELKNRIQSGKVSLQQGETFDSYLTRQSEAVERCLLDGEKGIDANDKEFGKFRTKKVIKKMLITAAVGLTVGAVVQEGVAFFKDDTQGLIEGIFHQDAHAITQTPLENLRGWITGHPSHMGLGSAIASTLDGHNFKLPEGTSILQNPDGTYNILRGGQVVSDHIPLTFDNVGNIDQESMARLGEDGIVAHTTCTTIEGTEQVKGDAEEYIKNHPGGTTHVSRIGWYDNDTPKPIFDQNELKLNWGGHNGVDTNGNYVLDMKHMTSDGSFHKEFSVDAQEKMKVGLLKMIFSLTQGTQNNVFEVPIDVNGNAIIDPNSEIGKLFFSTENGQAVFKGRFAEVVESFGDSHGVEHVKSLATLVGEGNNDIDHIVPVEIPTTNLGIPLDTEPPYFIPIITHSPLESLKNEKQKPNEPSPVRYLYLTGSTEDRKRWEKNRSPRLSKNPDAVLSQKEELEWYFDKQLKEKGEGYIQELDSFIEQNASLKNLRPDTKIAVCMPVAAAQEYENVYDTLSLYSKQDKEAVSKTVIVMNVNWPDDADMNNVQKTIDAIEKAKKDFPNLQIATFTKVWSRKWIDEKEGAIYGEVVKYVNDTALRSINKAGLDNDVYLLTNDADAKGMSKHYLSTYINSAEKNKNKDGFLGKIEWSPELYEKYPGYHLSMRMYQFLESSIRHSSIKKRNVASSGANFLVKAGTFAAIGGYNADMGAGADTDLGRSIKNARFGGRELLPEEKLPINYVNGAWIDTDPSRSFRYYKDGLPIVNQWNDFDNGGYQPRGDVSLLGDKNEDIENDFDSIIKRSSFQLTALINDWIGFDKVEEYTKALNMAFPPQKDLFGNTIFLWKVKKDDEGHNQVIFTDEGKVWIKKQLKNYKDKNLSDQIYKRGLRSKNKIEGEKKILKKTNKTELEKTTKEIVKPATVEAPIEAKKSKEIVSSESIKEIIKDKIGDLAKIEKLNLDFIGDTLKVEGALDAGILGGKIKIKGFLENNGDMLEIRSRDLDIEARGYIKSRINKNLSKLAPEMKKYFEEKYERSVKSIQIEKGQIALTFNK